MDYDKAIKKLKEYVNKTLEYHSPFKKEEDFIAWRTARDFTLFFENTDKTGKELWEHLKLYLDKKLSYTKLSPIDDDFEYNTRVALRFKMRDLEKKKRS